ncbi:MAG: hypothetical protein ACYS7Y_19175 [Planctomycetota bacterium]
MNREETILNRAVWFGVFLSACLLVWVFVSQCWSAEPAQEPPTGATGRAPTSPHSSS